MARTIGGPGAPGNLLTLESELPEMLGIPSGWVCVNYVGKKYHLAIALDVVINDDGDGESGPRTSTSVNRWVEIHPPNEARPAWTLHVFDVDQADYFPYGDAIPQVVVRFDMDMGVNVGGYILMDQVGSLFKALGVKYTESA